MSEWQPINTAPEDVVVLLGYFDDIKGFGCLHPDGDCWVQIGKLMICADRDPLVSVLAGAPNNDYVCIDSKRIPTHWMPLPEPPE